MERIEKRRRENSREMERVIESSKEVERIAERISVIVVDTDGMQGTLLNVSHDLI